MKGKFYLIFTFLLFGILSRAFAQSDNLIANKAVSALKDFVVEHPIEKAYLHLDHPYPYYVAGESIFFKAYVTMGQINLPSNISSILNVELLDKKDSLLQAVKIELTNGVGWGDFLLPENLQRGTYRIRAFTNWMRNESDPNFFEKYISVSSSHSTGLVSNVIEKTGKPNLQFFPEGGNLVVDIESKLGIKAIGSNGLGINYKGAIIDNFDKEVAKFSSTHLGMGITKFTPESGRIYKAKVVFENGYQELLDLPKVQNEGITLAINTNDTNKIAIEIKANRAFYKKNLNKGLSLIIYNGGLIKTVNTKLDNSVLGLDLPTSNLKTGILQATLFTETGEPICERLVFVKKNNVLKLSIASDKEFYKKREKVSFDLEVKNKDGNSTKGSYSVSVIDESKVLVDENSEITNLSYLLLSSDLRGYIEKPNYYFANNDNNARTSLDALMLTQGYRQFVWKELLDDKINLVKSFNPEKSVNIAGYLKNKMGEPVKQSKVMLINKLGGIPLEQITDDNGKFNFNDIVFYTGNNFILKTASSNGKNQVVLNLDSNYYGPKKAPISVMGSGYDLNADILAPTFVSQPTSANLTNDKSVNLATESNFVKKVPVIKNEIRSSKLGGSGGADQVILANQILPSSSLSASLSGIARGVNFVDGQPFLTGFEKPTNDGYAKASPMLLILDGTYVSDLNIVSPSDVESIEILKGANAGIYGINGADGVMVINTKITSEVVKSLASKGFEMSPGIFSISPKGIYKAKVFYSPKYDQNVLPNSEPDLRTTVYWQPNLVTDENGKNTISYCNADGVGTYRVVVEGIDVDGNLGRLIYRYKVVN